MQNFFLGRLHQTPTKRVRLVARRPKNGLSVQDQRADQQVQERGHQRRQRLEQRQLRPDKSGECLTSGGHVPQRLQHPRPLSADRDPRADRARQQQVRPVGRPADQLLGQEQRAQGPHDPPPFCLEVGHYGVVCIPTAFYVINTIIMR